MVWPLIFAGVSAGLQGSAASQNAESLVGATEADIAYKTRALQEQQRQRGTITDLLSPYSNMGQQFLPGLGASAESPNQVYDQLYQSPIVQQLLSDRMTQTEGALSTSGQRRSGYGATTRGNTVNNTLMPMEASLVQRQQNLAGIAQTSGMNEGAMGMNNVGSQNNILQALSNSQTRGIQDQALINAGTNQNMINLGAGTANYYR